MSTMEDAAHGFGDEALLRQLGWVRRLAAELVREPNAADDVTQDVARVALEKRAQFQGDERGFRAWLATVARRLAADRRRSDRARLGRERSVARSERDESAPSIAERSARARVVADAVQSLAEPYRATVLHRYFDDLSMAEVAERTSVDEATARKRLSRAREMLRARLERDGEHGGRAWLAAIAGTGVERAGAVPLTLGSGATAAVAVGVGAMVTKLVVGAALCCAVIAAWFLSRPDPEQTSPAMRAAVVESALEELALEPRAGIEAAPARGSERSGAAREQSDAVTAPTAPAHDGPRLRVRVVGADGLPVTSGLICVGPDRMPLRAFSSTRTPATVPIAGPVTDVPLPKGTQSATVSACTSGQIASRPSDVAKIAERETREITLEVGGGLAAPALLGRVLVDGVQRVPAGLAIYVSGAGPSRAYSRVNAVDGTWAIESVPEDEPHLKVTSAETVITHIDLDSDDVADGRYDLELSTGRSLVVKLLDPATGRPHADSGVVLRTNRRIEGNNFDSYLHILRTDELGVARSSGIPLTGSFSLIPDLDPLERALAMNGDHEPWRSFFHVEAWHFQHVTESDPAVIEVELRVDIPAPGASAYGFLAGDLLASVSEKRARVVSAEITAESPRGGDAFIVSHDASGRWTLTSHWPSRHNVWIREAESGAPLTEKVEVFLDGPREHGPIDLSPTAAANVELRIRGVPAGARVHVVIFEDGATPRSETPTLREGAGVHRFALAKPAQLSVQWSVTSGDDPQAQERTHRLSVDPAAARSFEVDFASGTARRVVFAPTGEALPARTKLVFVRWSPDAAWGSEVVLVTTGASGTVDDVRLAPGRWIWSCVVFYENVTAMGVLDVGQSETEIRIAPRIGRHPRTEFPNGLVWEEVDGIDLATLITGARTYTFEAAGDVLMREDARWSAAP